jgi:hypothetical protein
MHAPAPFLHNAEVAKALKSEAGVGKSGPFGLAVDDPMIREKLAAIDEVTSELLHEVNGTVRGDRKA